MHAALAEVLDAGRGEVGRGRELTPPTALIAELLVMAVLSLIRSRMLGGDGSPLVDLAPSLMRFVVEPYLGAGAANADAREGPAGRCAAPSQAEVVPIRPHPRVMRIAERDRLDPGLSSREIELAVSGKDRAASASRRS